MLSRAAGRTSCSHMPVVCSILNGHSSLCLVDTGSELSLVSQRVVECCKLWQGKAILTADGKSSHLM